MPAEARGRARKLPSGKWQLRYGPKSHGLFGSKTEALNHWRDVVEPELRGGPKTRRDLTFEQLVDVFLDRHGKVRSERTVRTLRERLKPAQDVFGDVPLADLEHDVDGIADFVAGLAPRWRHPVVLAFRQTLDAGIRYGYLVSNPVKQVGPNPAPPPRPIRVYTAAELKLICGELGPLEAAVVRFAAETGLRPAEWAQVERRDVDRKARRLTVRGTKTRGSRREVPLTQAALRALRTVPARLGTPYVFAAKRGGPFDWENFRRREWHDAIETAGIQKPARLYDLRSTFISNALARGLTVFETAKIAGSSVRMLELHYGVLLDSAHDSLLKRLEGFGH